MEDGVKTADLHTDIAFLVCFLKCEQYGQFFISWPSHF